MLKKYLSITGKANTERFRNFIDISDVDFLEEEYQNIWTFYDSSSATSESSVLEILEKLDINTYEIKDAD